MANILLEFNRSDTEAVINDQESFTISYEIELDSENPNVWSDSGDFDGESLIDLVPQEEILELASERFYALPIGKFFEHIGSARMEIGSVFLEWMQNLDMDQLHAMIIKSCDALGLITNSSGEVITGGDSAFSSYDDSIAALMRKEPPALKALAKNVLENSSLKKSIERTYGIEIKGEDLESVGLSIISSVGKEKVRSFMRGISQSPWSLGYMEDGKLDYTKYVKDFFTEKSNLQGVRPSEGLELYDILSSIENPHEIYRKIEDAINKLSGKLERPSDADDYEMSTFKLPWEVESPFEEWLQEEFESWRGDTEAEIQEDIVDNIGNYFNKADYVSGRFDLYDYDEDDIEYKVEEIFPNFYSKWGDVLVFEKDSSLSNGFEMHPETYFSSIEESFEFLEDFYSDYNAQSVFSFSENTGLHTNIGMEDEGGEWNYFKGFLFLNDKFATRGFESREFGRYSLSIRKRIIDFISNSGPLNNKTEIRRAILSAVEANFEEIESSMNKVITSVSDKDFGFSIRDGRVEFRYPGGDVSLEDLKSATMYYAYLVKLIKEPEFKRREYVKRAFSFIFGMSDTIEKSDYNSLILPDGEEITIGAAFRALKGAVDSNPNPEAMFYVKEGELVSGIFARNILGLIENGYAQKEGLDAQNVEGTNHKYKKFFSISNINKSANTVTINVYTLANGSLISAIKSQHSGVYSNIIGEIFIESKEEIVSIYEIGSAILLGKIETASTEQYSKIKLFMDKEKATEQRIKIWPWIQNFIKASEIAKKMNKSTIFSEEEAERIINGDFSMLKYQEKY